MKNKAIYNRVFQCCRLPPANKMFKKIAILLLALGPKFAFAGFFIPPPGACITDSGSNSVVCQGSNNVASGTNSFAAGTNARATATGAFIFTDASTPGVDVVNSSSNSIVLRFQSAAFIIPITTFTGTLYASNFIGNASGLIFSSGTPNQAAFFDNSGHLVSSGTFTFRTGFGATGANALKVGPGPATFNSGPGDSEVAIEIAGTGGNMAVMGFSSDGNHIGLFGRGPDSNFDMQDDRTLGRYIMRHEINSYHTTYGDNGTETDYGVAGTDIGFYGVSTYFRKEAAQPVSPGGHSTFYFSGLAGPPNRHFWFSEDNSAYHAMAGVDLISNVPDTGINQIPYFTSINTVLHSSPSFQSNGSSVTLTNIPLNLYGPNGTIVGTSSITASAFFGDGSHLSNVSIPASTNTITSTSTIGGYSSTLGAGTTFFAYLTDTSILLSRITVTINNAGTGGTGDTYACQDNAGNSLQVTVASGAPAGSVYTAAGSVFIVAGSTVNGLLLSSDATPTPVSNVICSFNKTFNASSTEHFPRASTEAWTTANFGLSGTVWKTEPTLSTVTLTMSGGRAMINFSCATEAQQAQGRILIGALIDGGFFNGETTTRGLGPLCYTQAGGTVIECPMSYSVVTQNVLTVGSHKFAFIYRDDGGSPTNFFNTQSQACQFSVTEL